MLAKFGISREIILKFVNVNCMKNRPVESALVQWRTEGRFGGVQPPPPYFGGPPNSCQTQPDCENCLKVLNLGNQPLPKMFGKKAVKF